MALSYPVFYSNSSLGIIARSAIYVGDKNFERCPSVCLCVATDFGHFRQEYRGFPAYIYIYIYKPGNFDFSEKSTISIYIYRVIYIPGHFNFSERTYHIFFLKPYSNNDFGAFIGFARRRLKFYRFLPTKIQFSIANLLKTTHFFPWWDNLWIKIHRNFTIYIYTGLYIYREISILVREFHNLYIYRVIYIYRETPVRTLR